jgi:phosphoglycerate kinase
MCFSFFRAQGIATGDSLVEEEGVKLAAEALERAGASECELVLPVDLVLGERFDAEAERRESDGVEVPDGWMGLDIGPESAAIFSDLIAEAKTIFWNGPMGVFELEPFAAATNCRRGGRRRAGDDRGRRRRLGRGGTSSRADRIDWISTGGGASLSYWREKTARIEALRDA